MIASCRNSIYVLFAVAVCAFLFAPPAPAYDGPAGVTFRAPLVARAAAREIDLQEGLSLKVEVRIDSAWSMETDGKGRAFPNGFIATIADSQISFRLRNQGTKKVKTNILVPFDSSTTVGTGFTGPLSIDGSVDGRRVSVAKGPELARGMMKIRSFRVPVELSANGAAEIVIRVSHPLAINPAWYTVRLYGWQFAIPRLSRPTQCRSSLCI